MNKQVKITLLRSTIGCSVKQKATIKALGLKKIRTSNTFNESPTLLGMIKIVNHLVKVEEV